MQPEEKSTKQRGPASNNVTPVMEYHFMPLCDTSELLTEKSTGYSTVKSNI